MYNAPVPLFSIIVPHYQGSEPHDIFLRGIKSLADQTCKDFEILCYHDGPLLNPSVKFPVAVKCTGQQFNDWGHSLRDIGIKEARGDYIVHFNADNVLYPDALETIKAEIFRAPRLFHPTTGITLDTNDIIIFPVKMIGTVYFRGAVFRDKGSRFYQMLTGIPPTQGNIDAMQLVMKRSLWMKHGGWIDKSYAGDGAMYERFCQQYGHRHIGPVLGEHW